MIIRQLHRLDRQAADAVKKGESPLKINSKQQGLQDQLNVVELRLAILSSRHGLDVPSPPQAEASKFKPVTNEAQRQDQASQELTPDGNARTRMLIQQDVMWMLAGLTFDGYPGGAKGDR